MADIHFDCPKCKRPMAGNEELKLHTVTCPDCQQQFLPVPKIQTPPAAVVTLIRPPISRLSDEAETIKTHAGFLCFAAIICVVIAVIISLFGLQAAVATEPCAYDFILSGSLIGLALWLYLIAQVVHIRANTEK